MGNLKLPKKLKGFLLEIPASFVLVLLYFLFLDYTINPDIEQAPITGALFFGFIFFMISLFYHPGKDIDLLPVITFIKVLYRNDFSYFLVRVGGQIVGAVLATYLIFTITQTVENSDLSRYVFPLNPFLSGLFMGLFALYVFLIHFFIVGTQKPRHFRFFLFSLGLGLAFYFLSFFEGITLFNPFGILFMHIFKNGTFGLETVLLDILIHIITPMAFIAGTFFFMKGFIKTDIEEEEEN